MTRNGEPDDSNVLDFIMKQFEDIPNEIEEIPDPKSNTE